MLPKYAGPRLFSYLLNKRDILSHPQIFSDFSKFQPTFVAIVSPLGVPVERVRASFHQGIQ